MVTGIIFKCPGQFKVEGTVSDALTNEGLQGAYIAASMSAMGTTTDMNSHFELLSDKLIDSITVRFVGYRTLTLPASSEFMDIRMEQLPNELNQVIVSAMRERQSRINAPIAISLLAPKVVEETKATEMSHLLSKVSGVLISDFGAENASVSIRQPLSFIRTQLVTLEDEIPINPTTIASSSNMKEINLAAIRSVEVLRGPASSIYGSEAIGGTLNFITKKPPLVPYGAFSVQANDMGYKRIDLEGGNAFNKLGLFAGGYAARCSDTYRDYCDFWKIALNLKGVYSIDDNTKLTGSFNFLRHNANLSGSLDSTLFYTNDKYNQYAFSYSNLLIMRASARIDKTWSANDKTFLTLHFRKSFEDQIPTYYIQRIYGGPPPAKYKGEYIESGYQSYGLVMQHHHSFGFLDAKLIAGISADITPYDYISKQIDVTREGELYTSYTMTDVYVQDFNADLLNSAGYLVFEFSPLKKTKVTSAVRYDRLDYNYRNNLPPTAISGAPDDKNAFDHISPKIGINYNLSHNIGFYGNFSVGFAPPMFSQLYKAVTVPLLKPSNYDNFELGGWLSFNGDNGYVDISAYRSMGNYEIVSVILADGTSQDQSTGATRHEGIEYSFRYSFLNQLDIRFNAASSVHKFVHYINGTDVYNGNYMTLAPKFVSNSELIWRPPFLKNFRIGLEWEKIGKYWVDELNTKEYDGYSIFNIRTGYRFNRFNIWVNVLNVENDLYAVRVTKSSYGTRSISYVPGPRRSVFFGMEYKLSGKDKSGKKL